MEEKKYPIGGFAPGNYQGKCYKCGYFFLGDKRAVECESCAVAAKEKFDALSPEEQAELVKKNVQIASEMFDQIKAGKPFYPGSSYQNLFDYLTKEHSLILLESQMNDLINVVHKHHPAGAAWVNCNDTLPKDDSLEDFPAQYILKGHNDGRRGEVDIHQVTFDEMKDVIRAYDWCEWLDESGTPASVQIDRDWIFDILIEFTIAYNRSTNKDIANDAAEYLNDKLKDAGINYVLSEDESPASAREEDAVEFGMWLAKEKFESVNGKTMRSSNWNAGMPYSPSELYELFKQQKANP